VNNVHRARLRAIYDLPGYSGSTRGVGSDGDGGVASALRDFDGSIILADEDDTLCDEANRLETCMAE
jgi:hypothetical protein